MIGNGRWYWRVRALNEDDRSHWSEIFEFFMTDAPRVPILITPARDTTMADLRPYFSWQYLDRLSIFDLQIDDQTDFQDPEVEVQVYGNGRGTKTGFRITEDLSFGTWFWRVRDHSANNEWSQTWSFTLISCQGRRFC